MKSRLIGLVAFATAFSVTEMAWGDISTQATAQIGAIDSSGNFLPLISENVLDFDQLAAESAVAIAGGTDIGSATARAFAIGSHLKQRLIGGNVGGQANITRPESIGFLHYVTGELSVGATSDVEFSDELLFTFEPSFPDQVRITGFLNLRGNLNFATIENGPNIGTFASAFLSISGTGLTPAEAGGNTTGLPSLNQTIGEVSLFSFDVSQGVPKPITFRMRAVGQAQIAGAQFVVNAGASAAAGFEVTFQNSLDWGGITSVVNLSTGEPITNWSVTSKSGFDYSQVFPPIPEPSSLALLTFGLCAWLGRARRRGWRAAKR